LVAICYCPKLDHAAVQGVKEKIETAKAKLREHLKQDKLEEQDGVPYYEEGATSKQRQRQREMRALERLIRDAETKFKLKFDESKEYLLDRAQVPPLHHPPTTDWGDLCDGKGWTEYLCSLSISQDKPLLLS
jgi:hypothetical protein